MDFKEIVGRFAKVNTDAYSEYGVNLGDIAIVAGSGFAPVDDDDNYKLLFVISKVVDGKPQDHGITVARKHLDMLSDEENKILRGQLELNFPANNDEAEEEPPEAA